MKFFRNATPIGGAVMFGEINAGEEEALGVNLGEIDLFRREAFAAGRDGEELVGEFTSFFVFSQFFENGHHLAEEVASFSEVG